MKKCKDCDRTIECPHDGVCMFNPSDCASDALHDLVVPPQCDAPERVDGPRCAEQVLVELEENLRGRLIRAEGWYERIKYDDFARGRYSGICEEAERVLELIEQARAKHAAAREERPSGRRNAEVCRADELPKD